MSVIYDRLSNGDTILSIHECISQIITFFLYDDTVAHRSTASQEIAEYPYIHRGRIGTLWRTLAWSFENEDILKARA